jgi:hypothetical protein
MKPSQNMLTVSFVAYAIIIGIAIFLYFRPKFMQQPWPWAQEGFTTIAIDGETIPKCLLRDIEAQNLLSKFQGMKQKNPTPESNMEYDELKLILQKALCLDADVTGPAAGPYSTFQFPFATSHDIEPTASFVGRCVRRVVRERDIEMLIDKYLSRGETLIGRLCDGQTKQSALTSFRNVIGRVKKNITPVCMSDKANLDRPTGARDPGYYESDSIKNLQPYEITGKIQYI